MQKKSKHQIKKMKKTKMLRKKEIQILERGNIHQDSSIMRPKK